MTVFGPV